MKKFKAVRNTTWGPQKAATERPWLSIATWRLTLAGCLIASVAAVSSARAQDLQTFDLTYDPTTFSGSDSINTITSADPAEVATGVITLDLSAIQNPGNNSNNTSPFVTAFTLTISGTGAGDGTFGIDDFTGGGSIFLNTDGGTLNFSQQLIGQPTSGDPYGTPGGSGGDFNFFSNGDDSLAPTGETYFTFVTDNGAGDAFILTSFAPVPEPSSLPIGGVASLGIIAYWLRRRRSAAREATTTRSS
jgi:hypothetical protein